MGKYARIPVGNGKKRNVEQRERDIVFCTELFLKGYTYKEIAAELNVFLKKQGIDYQISYISVYNDLKKVMIEWKREQLNNINEYIVHELRKLDKMEATAWKGWEDSKIRKSKVVHRKPGKLDSDESDGFGYDQLNEETTAGNPKFLDILLDIQRRRAKMLGFDAPTKIEVPGYNAADKPAYDVNAIPEDMLFKLADVLQDSEHKAFMEEKNGNEKESE